MVLSRRSAVSFLIEFGPVFLFFAGSEVYEGMDGFYFGTKLLVIATPLALIAAYVRDRRLALFPLMVSLFMLLLALATLITGDPLFLQVEYTLYNGLLGALLLIGLAFKKIPLKRMFDSLLAISDRGWEILSLRFGILLILIALLNEMILRLYGLELWVFFRFSSYVFTILFGIFQAGITKKYRLDDSSPWGLRK